MDPLSLLALFGIGFVAIGLIGDSDEPGTETEADPMVWNRRRRRQNQRAAF